MALTGFHYLYDINGGEQMVLEFIATTGTTFVANDILEFNAGTVRKATAGSTSIAGVAVEGVTNAAAGTKVQVIVNKGAVFRTGYYAGGTKTSFAVTDIGTAFDLYTGAQSVNPDDTTGGMCIVIAYNNTDKTVDVALKSRLLNQ